MLYVCPELFTHRWELKLQQTIPELIIDIPKNIEAVLENPEGTPASSVPYEGKISSKIAQRRINLFDQRLRQLIARHYENMKHSLLKKPLDKQIASQFSPYDSSQNTWPWFYDCSKAPAIPTRELSEMPKSREVEKVTDFLQKYTIRGFSSSKSEYVRSSPLSKNTLSLIPSKNDENALSQIDLNCDDSRSVVSSFTTTHELERRRSKGVH